MDGALDRFAKSWWTPIQLAAEKGFRVTPREQVLRTPRGKVLRPVSKYGMDPRRIRKALRPGDTRGSVAARNMPLAMGGGALGAAAGVGIGMAARKPVLGGAIGTGAGVAPGSFRHASEQRQLRRRNRMAGLR